MRQALFLFALIVIAIALRFWQLGAVPASPDWDEVALGYNAYSISQTGKDEYGTSYPIILRSFDDYKPALYTYLVIPFIKMFGLEVFAVRMPSAILGVITVVAVYFLLKELFKDQRIPVIGSLLFAISPWHLQFSRIAFESSVGLSFNIFAILFFLKALKKPWFLLLSVFFAGLSLHVYQSEKVFVPLLFLALTFIFRKELFRLPKPYIGASFLLGMLLTLPLIWQIATQPGALLRARGVSIFTDNTSFLARTIGRLGVDMKQKDLLGLVLDNRRITYAFTAVSGYISHFDLNWLFIAGDQQRHHAPNMGLLYLVELPFLLMGIYLFVFGPFEKKTKYFIFAWFLIAAIPASITSGVPHPIRTLNFLPTFQLFTAIGIIGAVAYLKSHISNPMLRYMLVGGYLFLAGFNFFYYLNQYFVQQNIAYSQFWQYGYQQAVDFVNKEADGYDKIVVTNKPPLDQSYIFFLFYLKYPPEKYQEAAKNVSGGFSESHAFSKYEFRPFSWEEEERSSRILFVGRPDDFPEDTSTVKTIYFLD